MLKLFTVKPLLVIYMMSWAVTSAVGTQLWLFKTCRNYYNQTGITVSKIKFNNNNIPIIQMTFVRIWLLPNILSLITRSRPRLMTGSYTCGTWKSPSP